MSVLESTSRKRLVTLIEKAPKGMPEPPPHSVKHSKCYRCGGSGVYYRFGTCYRCGGNGRDPIHYDYHVDLDNASPEWLAWAEEVIAKRDAANAKRKATRDAKKAAEEAEKARKHEGEAEALLEKESWLKEAAENAEALAAADPFAHGVLESILKWLNPSDKQKAIIERGMKRVAERAAEDALPKEPVVEGRTEIVGVVKGFKDVPDRFSYNGGTILKMIVRDDRGFKVYGTCPLSLEAERGDRVRFRATVEKSKDDEFFGFFKRPAKAEIIEEAKSKEA